MSVPPSPSSLAPSPSGDSEPQGVGEICLQNIGPRERRKRAMFGLVLLVPTLALALLLIVAGVPRAWRLVLFLPFAASAVGFAQARART